MLQWRTVTPSNDPKFMVDGYVLAAAYVPGTQSRFLVEEVRCRVRDAVDGQLYSSTTYRVRDAATVSDADVAAGKSSRVVYRSDDMDLCVKFAKEA